MRAPRSGLRRPVPGAPLGVARSVPLPAPYRASLQAASSADAVRGAAEFITVSDGVADMYERRYGRRPVLLRNVHDLRVDEEADLDLRTESVKGVTDDEFLARHRRQRQAIRHDPRAAPGDDRASRPCGHLALMGRGWGQYKPRRSARLGLEGRVHIFGGVAPTKVTKTITTADAALVNIRATEVQPARAPDQVLPRDLSRPPDPLPAAAVGVVALFERVPRARPADRRRGPRLDRTAPAHPRARTRR